MITTGNYVGLVFLDDLKKNYQHRVDQQMLLKKLFCYGFRNIYFDLFIFYLSD